MTYDKNAIQAFKESQIQTILQEINQFGSFKSQYKNLKNFRKSLRPFYRWKISNKLVSYKGTQIKQGDILDHHIAAYFSPFSFKRESWGGGGRIAL